MRPTRTLLAIAIAAVVLPASAAQFDFYKLNQSNNPTTDFLPVDGVRCTKHDLCGSNVDGNLFGDNLTYIAGGITAVATAAYGGTGGRASVVQDSTLNWSASKGAGLGVYHLQNVTSDDNITELEKLIITFDRIVRLTSIGLRAEGHNYTGWDDGATFLFDNVQTALPKGTGSIDVDKIGQVFSFEFDMAKRPNPNLTLGDQFYLSSMTAFAVPEPASLALVLAALAGLAISTRRRKTQP